MIELVAKIGFILLLTAATILAVIFITPWVGEWLWKFTEWSEEFHRDRRRLKAQRAEERRIKNEIKTAQKRYKDGWPWTK